MNLFVIKNVTKHQHYKLKNVLITIISLKNILITKDVNTSRVMCVSAHSDTKA